MKSCNSCYYYAHSEYLVCANYPQGNDANSCADYRVNPRYSEQWCPDGYYYYDGQLYKNPEPKSVNEQLWLLDNHPLFTGKCPNCGYQFEEDNLVHWDCPKCGWIDDSV